MEALFMPHRPSQRMSRRSSLAVGSPFVGVSSAGSSEQAGEESGEEKAESAEE